MTTHTSSTLRHPLLRGFTLLEMSIVLVIISLIIGGIVTARAMTRAAQLRDVLREYDIYLKAVKEFQDKYNALPGDMNNAQTDWGVDPVGCPDTTYSAAAKVTTCNGDGSGTIGNSTTAGVVSVSTEWWRAWQQLSDAGFIAGSFSGVQGATGVGNAFQATVGVNVPASQLASAGWTLFYYLYPNNGTNSNTGANLWVDQYAHVMSLGGQVSGFYTTGAVLNPIEAYSVDQKIDDGKPGTGAIRTWRRNLASNANCLPSAGGGADGDGNQTTATYNTTYDSGYACSLLFITGF